MVTTQGEQLERFATSHNSEINTQDNTSAQS